MQCVTICKHELFSWIISTFFMYFIFFDLFLLISSYGKPVWSFPYVKIYCFGAGVTTLMSISDGLDPYFFRRKMEKTRSMEEGMDGELFISRQSRHFSFIDTMIRKHFPISTLIWHVNKYISLQGTCINRRNEKTIIFTQIVAFCNMFVSEDNNCLFSLKTFPQNMGRYPLLL